MSKTDSKERLYTEENSKLAAYLQGDPNEIHINNRFGEIIAPGLMQLAGFITRVGWRPRNRLEISLTKPLIVPSKAYYDNLDLKNHYLLDENKIYSSAKIYLSKPPRIPLSTHRIHNYFIEDDPSIKEIENWKNYSKIPINSLSEIVPKTSQYNLEHIAATSLAVNALVKELDKDKNLMPELFFPGVREDGEYAILEKKLELYMGFSKENTIKDFKLAVHEPIYDEKNKRNLSIWITETSGIYGLKFELKKMRKKVLKKMFQSDD